MYWNKHSHCKYMLMLHFYQSPFIAGIVQGIPVPENLIANHLLFTYMYIIPM